MAVVGGGDSACEEANFLTRFASKVYLIHRRDELRASKIMADRVLSNPKVEAVWDSEVLDIIGSKADGVKGIKIKNKKTNAEKIIDLILFKIHCCCSKHSFYICCCLCFIHRLVNSVRIFTHCSCFVYSHIFYFLFFEMCAV